MIRAFRGNFLIAIDDEEAVAEEQRTIAGPVTLEELKNYLKQAVRIDWDDEEHGNEPGVQSIEALVDSIVELPPDEVQRLYNKS